jgi:signal transduction histidine kinase
LIQLAQLGQSLSLPVDVNDALAWIVIGEKGTVVNRLNEAKILHFRLKTEDHNVGWLSLAHNQPGIFTDRDLEFITVISSHLAAGLDNRVLYHTIDLARQEWEAIFNTIQDAILVHDVNDAGLITRVNKPLVKWLDISVDELLHQPVRKIKIDSQGNSLWDLALPLLSGKLSNVSPLSTEFNSPTWASERSFRVRTFPLYRQKKLVEIVHILEDITQASKIQAQMIQTEKLSALGRLSASLAHEINNPLQALRSGLRLLSRPNLSKEKREKYVSIMTNEVERLVKLTTQTLDFARPSRVGKERTNLNELLEETLILVGKQLQQHKINVSLELNQTLPSVYVVPAQIKQVFLNLILNAVDALSKGGHLKLISHCTPNDKYVVVSIMDDGAGISQEFLERISEPFFTTKEAGTGLGLAISYSIVEAHGGHIEIRTRLGKGSRFSIHLPVNQD